MVLFHSACEVLAVPEEEIFQSTIGTNESCGTITTQLAKSFKVYRRQQIAIKHASLDACKNSQLEEGSQTFHYIKLGEMTIKR
jgi:hypothetical protein